MKKRCIGNKPNGPGIHRRIQQGLCWYPVVPGKSYYNSLNQLVVEIGRLEDKETEHNFEYGRPVCFFTTKGGGKPEYLNFSAVISYVQDDRMVVILPSPNALTEIQKAGEIGVQLYFDETSYKTMFNALSTGHPSEREPVSLSAGRPVRQTPAAGAHFSPSVFLG